MPSITKISFFVFFLLLIGDAAKSQAGVIDSNFGENGIATTPESPVNYLSYSSLLQKDGKIVSGGHGGETGGFLVMRFKSDGTVDSLFGTNGQFSLHLEEYFGEEVFSLAEQKDGKILVCGDGYRGLFEGNYNGIVLRLNADGSLDSSFGVEGKFIYDSNLPSDHFRKVLLREDGKILLCGTVISHSILLVQLLSDGHLDTQFGDMGISNNSDDADFVKDAALLQDGSIIVAGTFNNGGIYRFFISKYSANGHLDEQFGNNGKAITNLPSKSEEINAIAIQSDGKILATGSSNQFDKISTLARYTTEGSLDVSFGSDGIVYTPLMAGWGSIQDLVIQPDGKIITGVYNFDFDNGFANFAANRYQTNGNLDSLFGSNGTVITPVDNNPYLSSILLQPDGKFILSGFTILNSTPVTSLALARYNGDGIEKDKYVKIKKWLHHHGFTWEDKPDRNISYYSIQRSNSNNAFNEIAKLFNSSNQQQYSYEDIAPLSGDNYYRVAVVSADGSINYSNIVAINNGEAFIKVYPNPAKNNLHIEGLSATAKTTLTVTDINGNKSISTTVTANAYNLNVSQLKQGSYFLKIESKGNVVVKKFVKE